MENNETKAADTPSRFQSRMDYLSAGSFITAGVVGAVTICNNVRQKFYHRFVVGYGGKFKTSFQDIILKYDGGVNDRGEKIKGEFEKLSEEFNQVSERYRNKGIDQAEVRKASATFNEKTREVAKEFRKEIATRLLDEHNIPTHGISGWTEGLVKRWKELGKHARMDTGFGFAAVTAIGIGAVSILRHSKHTLDRIETDLDHQRNSASR